MSFDLRPGEVHAPRTVAFAVYEDTNSILARGVPEDLAGIAVFLAAPASDFVTGAAIPVDGGFASSSA